MNELNFSIEWKSSCVENQNGYGVDLIELVEQMVRVEIKLVGFIQNFKSYTYKYKLYDFN